MKQRQHKQTFVQAFQRLNNTRTVTLKIITSSQSDGNQMQESLQSVDIVHISNHRLRTDFELHCLSFASFCECKYASLLHSISKPGSPASKQLSNALLCRSFYLSQQDLPTITATLHTCVSMVSKQRNHKGQKM